jgi:hypothetical protein
MASSLSKYIMAPQSSSPWGQLQPLALPIQAEQEKPKPLVASNDPAYMPYSMNDDGSIGFKMPPLPMTDEEASQDLPHGAPKKPKAAAKSVNPAEDSSLDAPTGIDEQIAQQYLAQLNKRQGMVDNEDAMLEKYKNGGQTGFNAVNLKPLLAYADSLYGSKTAGSYDAPETPDERNQKLLALTQAAQKSRGDLSDDQMGYLKMKADNSSKLAHYQQQAEVANMRADLARQGLGLRERSVDLKEDKLAGDVGEKFNGGLMKQYQGTLENLNRADSLLNGKQPITTSTFNMLQQDFIGAVAQGGAATEGKVHREMIEDFQTKLNSLRQKFGEQADLRVSDPKTLAYLQALITHIKGDYQKAQARMSQNIVDAHSASTSPKVQQTLKKNASKYVMPAEPPNAGAGAHPEDDAALTWAKANPQDARSSAILKANGQ